jgi:hypothetical protein
VKNFELISFASAEELASRAARVVHCSLAVFNI